MELFYKIPLKNKCPTYFQLPNKFKITWKKEQTNII